MYSNCNATDNWEGRNKYILTLTLYLHLFLCSCLFCPLSLFEFLYLPFSFCLFQSVSLSSCLILPLSSSLSQSLSFSAILSACLSLSLSLLIFLSLPLSSSVHLSLSPYLPFICLCLPACLSLSLSYSLYLLFSLCMWRSPHAFSLSVQHDALQVCGRTSGTTASASSLPSRHCCCPKKPFARSCSTMLLSGMTLWHR